MKYGVRIDDWNLYEIEELLEVREFTEDYSYTDAFGKHVFKKEDFCWAVAKDNIFITAKWDGKYYQYDHTNEGPYYKKAIFDTREEAENYGREHSRCMMF